ncbi:MAG: CBS domain-containing protein [Chlorobi bacterium]|nr:CBS domain-containing protein [Chlorobiota bacterium]
MKVKEIMRKSYVSVTPDTQIKKVNQLLHQFHLKYLLITNEENELIGIVTYSDLFRHLLPKYSDFLAHTKENILKPDVLEEKTMELIHRPVTEIMTREPEKISPDLPIIEAGALMLAHKVKQLPVVEENKLTGVITYADITWGLLIKNCKYF